MQIIEMISHKYPAMFLILLIILIQLADCQDFREVFAQSTSPSGVTFSGYLLFQYDRGSAIMCALRCFHTPGCQSFTFTNVPQSGNCRGHSEIMVFSDTQVMAAGAKFYVFKEKSAWKSKNCSVDTDCLPGPSGSHVRCFHQKCLCRQGNFYSETFNTCLRDCPPTSLSSNFMEYPQSGMVDYNDDTMNGTAEACRQACLDATAFTCSNVERDSADSRCFLSKNTANTDNWDENSPGWIWYQRTCQ